MDGRRTGVPEPVDVIEIARCMLRPYAFETVRRGVPGTE